MPRTQDTVLKSGHITGFPYASLHPRSETGKASFLLSKVCNHSLNLNLKSESMYYIPVWRENLT